MVNINRALHIGFDNHIVGRIEPFAVKFIHQNFGFTAKHRAADTASAMLAINNATLQINGMPVGVVTGLLIDKKAFARLISNQPILAGIALQKHT